MLKTEMRKVANKGVLTMIKLKIKLKVTMYEEIKIKSKYKRTLKT